MTAFDLVVVAVVALSGLFGFARGFVRVVMSLLALVFAIILAIQLAVPIGSRLPDFAETPATRYIVAFALIAIVVLIVGALLGWMLFRLVRAIGLGFLDRLLGGIVGVARGVVFVVIGVVVAGATSLPRELWWQNALLAPPLVAAALALRPWLPSLWAQQLDYGKSLPPVRKPAARTGV
ncbi:MAG: CvpA family protein [Casimicrobiaceae bacterium]